MALVGSQTVKSFMSVSYSSAPLEYGTCRVSTWVGFFVGVFAILFSNGLVDKPSQSLRDNRATLPSSHLYLVKKTCLQLAYRLLPRVPFSISVSTPPKRSHSEGPLQFYTGVEGIRQGSGRPRMRNKART